MAAPKVSQQIVVAGDAVKSDSSTDSLVMVGAFVGLIVLLLVFYFGAGSLINKQNKKKRRRPLPPANPPPSPSSP